MKKFSVYFLSHSVCRHSFLDVQPPSSHSQFSLRPLKDFSALLREVVHRLFLCEVMKILPDPKNCILRNFPRKPELLLTELITWKVLSHAIPLNTKLGTSFPCFASAFDSGLGEAKHGGEAKHDGITTMQSPLVNISRYMHPIGMVNTHIKLIQGLN